MATNAGRKLPTEIGAGASVAFVATGWAGMILAAALPTFARASWL